MALKLGAEQFRVDVVGCDLRLGRWDLRACSLLPLCLCPLGCCASAAVAAVAAAGP